VTLGQIAAWLDKCRKDLKKIRILGERVIDEVGDIIVSFTERIARYLKQFLLAVAVAILSLTVFFYVFWRSFSAHGQAENGAHIELISEKERALQERELKIAERERDLTKEELEFYKAKSEENKKGVQRTPNRDGETNRGSVSEAPSGQRKSGNVPERIRVVR